MTPAAQILKKTFGIRGSLPYAWITSWFTHKCHGTVQSGPFFGLKTPGGHVGCKYCPRVLGIYEIELHQILSTILTNAFHLVVDVGAAEGYYAIGLARSVRVGKVVAFETDLVGQETIRQSSKINGTEGKVVVRGNADADALADVLTDGKLDNASEILLIMDIEGGEADLLDPGSIPALSNVHILVELHEQYAPGVAETIRKRFSGTHEIETITSRPRNIDDLPIRVPWVFRHLMKKWLLMATEDGRDITMTWFWMLPR